MLTAYRRCIIALALLLLCPALHAMAAETPTHLRLPMSDGTELATDYYLPGTPEEGPWPIILVRSTYGRVGGPLQAILRLGYGVVVQDVRGMGESAGEPYVFHADGWQDGLHDGADTVQWVKAQPWCNGKIGTWGGSALGITQMLMAPVTDALSAQFIEVAPANLYHGMTYQGGVFRKSLLEGWLPQINQVHLLDVYKAHPQFDDFWNAYNVERRAPDINAPAFFVGGWFDIFNQGTIDAFTSRENNGGPGAKGKNYLIMKWSTHGGDVTTDYKHNPNRFSLNIPLLMAAFFAGNLQGNAGAMSILPKVQYYTMGADTEGAPGNEWRSADAWPPFPTTETAYFLSAEGTLGTSTPTEGAQAYTFDPANPVPTRGGANLILPAGPFDQREVIAGRDDILQFATAPLETPLEITGRVKVKLYISSDAPDTDFTAKLLDLYPPEDGRQIGILDSIRRVKTRLGFDNIAPPLQGADDIVELEIDLQSISWIFDKGHRIGLHISSSNSPRFEVNPNTGADFPSPEAPGVPARNTVHLGGKHPSALYLPVR